MPRTPTRLPYVQRRQLRDGSFSFRGWCQVGGRRVFSPFYPTEKQAHDAALRMQRTAASVAEGITLEQGCDLVLEEVKTKRTAGSLSWYRGHLDAVRLVIPKGTPLHRITPATIEAFIQRRLQDWAAAPKVDKDGNVLVPGRHVKPATVNADLRALHRVFAVAIRHGHCDANPVQQVTRPRVDVAPMDWFLEDEFRTLVAKVADPWAAALFVVLAGTGLRRSELARLRVDAVRLERRQIVVAGKNGTRTVPFGAELVAPLRVLLAQATPDGAVVAGGLRQIDATFQTWRRQLGERRWHAHALRHTYGTALARGGTRADVLMRLMGHAAIKTTMRYVHEVGADGEEAVARLQVAPQRAPDRAASD